MFCDFTEIMSLHELASFISLHVVKFADDSSIVYTKSIANKLSQTLFFLPPGEFIWIQRATPEADPIPGSLSDAQRPVICSWNWYICFATGAFSFNS